MGANMKKANNSASQFSDVYGFILWIFVRICSVLYLMWALIPDEFWHSHGINYYPSRIWSISIPTYLCVSWWCLILGYVGYNYYYSLEWNSIHYIKDGFAECPIKAKEADEKQMNDSILYTKNNKQTQNTKIIPPVPNCC